MTDARYQRLPGKGRHLAGSDRLLLADDHLLLARRQLYIESYQRFFFADIQALTLRATAGRDLAAAILGGLVLLFAWAFWATDLTGLKVFWGVLGLGALLTSLVNWLRGPSVKCHLTTELQTVELTSLNRRRRAERILGRLEAEVRQAQADLALPDERSPDVEDTAAGPVAPSAQPSKPAPRLSSKPPPLPSVYDGFWHWLLFALLLVDSAVTYWQIQTDAISADFVATALFLVELVVVFFAIHRQRSLVVARPVKNVTWTAMGFMLVLLVGTWIYGMYVGFTSALESATAGGSGLIDPIAVQVQAEPMSWVSLVGTTTIGLAGLAVMSSVRRRPRASDIG